MSLNFDKESMLKASMVLVVAAVAAGIAELIANRFASAWWCPDAACRWDMKSSSETVPT